MPCVFRGAQPPARRGWCRWSSRALTTRAGSCWTRRCRAGGRASRWRPVMRLEALTSRWPRLWSHLMAEAE
eukprot:6616064-Pyramimonas_sp.AAC.1